MGVREIRRCGMWADVVIGPYIVCGCFEGFLYGPPPSAAHGTVEYRNIRLIRFRRGRLSRRPDALSNFTRAVAQKGCGFAAYFNCGPPREAAPTELFDGYSAIRYTGRPVSGPYGNHRTQCTKRGGPVTLPFWRIDILNGPYERAISLPTA